MSHTDDDGRLNNFAVEPKMYQAEPVTDAQKRTYVLIAVGTTALMGGLIAFAFFVS